MLISFSGIDGAGKSTLIDFLKKYFKEKDREVVVLTMYDHISFYSFIRKLRDIIRGPHKDAGSPAGSQTETLAEKEPHQWAPSQKLRDPKIGAEDKKGVLAKFVYSLIRSVFFRRVALFFDLMVLQCYIVYYCGIKHQVLITDRYLYDSLADVADLQSRRWSFIRFFLFLMPRPDIPILVEVSAEKAYARKKEYPVEYANWRIGTYRKIFSWIKDPLIIINDDLELSFQALRQRVELVLKSEKGKTS